MKSFCIVLPYYGHWPNYFSFFLKGCEHNPELQILLVTDLPITQRLPTNIKRLHLSFEELRERIQKTLQTPIKLISPYKLCDLRPMYGIIFAKELEHFDYWGHGDMDLIYGNVTSVLYPLFDTGYDVIAFDRLWLSGPFCFYRNNTAINNLFRQSPDWKRILQEETATAFDECGKIHRELIQGKSLQELPGVYQSMTHVCFKAAAEGRIHCYHEDHIKEMYNSKQLELYKFNHGNLTCNGNFVFLYHFLIVQKLWCFAWPEWENIPDVFYWDHTGFYSSKNVSRRRIIRIWRYIHSLPILLKKQYVRVYHRFFRFTMLLKEHIKCF